MIMLNRIVEALKTSQRILVASHHNPDGDALGSLLALGLALEEMSKQVTLYNESPVPAVYRFLPAATRVVPRVYAAKPYDVAVVLDCGDLERLGKALKTILQIPILINIDHHVTNPCFGHLYLVDTQACATCEIVYHLIKALKVPFSRGIATCIYTGILTDTGSFRFSNTNRKAFAISEEMIQCGVDPYHIAQHVYGTYSLGRIKLLNLALDSIELSASGRVSMMALTRNMFDETGTHPEDVDGMINYARRIQDVKVAVLIQELTDQRLLFRENARLPGIPKSQPNFQAANHSTSPVRNGRKPFHVSLRSDGSVDVAAIAARFGGGGHFSAAGFNVEATLPEIKEQILELTGEI